MNKNYETIKYEITDGIITVWLNRPQVHNAFNDTMLAELVDILETIDTNDDIRVVIVTGEGKSFSAGADLNWMKKMVDYTYEENHKDSLMISKVFYTIYTLTKPVISAINGAAIGGGMGFVGASDIVIASEKAKFSLSEVKIGVVPACISPYLIKRAGEGVLKELFISGMRFDADKALDIRLINYKVPHEKLLETAMETARKLCQCGPHAIGVCKRLFVDVPEMSLKEAYEHTTEVIARLRVSPEAQEGMKAFLEKRDPSWKKS
ncbi:MAG: enoyl-CoA hydratase/isomerase family protein [bacterium]|nr:enoyl-CoA hydratase/isomerase family protein [bacterium]